jgi:hypothetical protein
MVGMRFGTDGGARNAKVAVRVAVQNAVAELAPAVGMHVTAVESALVPFLNCTVPVGPAPLLVVATVAVSITLPPEAILIAEALTVVVVDNSVAVLTVSVGGAGFASTPPPGVGLKVSTAIVCAVARLLAGTCTLRTVELCTVTSLAGNGLRLNRTSVWFVPPTKLLPFTVSTRLLVPAVADVGEMDVIPGTGLRTVNTIEFVEVAPFTTET